MDCVHGYFASRGACWPCNDSGAAMSWRVGAAVVVGIGAFVVIAAAFTLWYRTVANAPVGFAGGFLMEAKQNAPVLLQTCQLWAVLSALSTSQSIEGGERMRSLADWEVKLPELHIIGGLTFSLIDLEGTFNFQCLIDGVAARYWIALLSPIVPLIFICVCGLMELAKPGSGIGKVLLVLSVFFVGGISSCTKLVSCKHYDADGRDLGDFAFQELMPSLKCSEPLPEVQGVFFATLLFYVVVIPGFLLYLFVKQHIVLQRNKLFMNCAKPKMEGREFHFEQIPSERNHQFAELQDQMLERRLVAGAVAYSAMFSDHEVQVNLKAATVTVQMADERRSSSDLFNLESLEALSADVVDLKRDADALRCRAITEMLMERCVLYERCELALPDERERVLAGARDMLMKYVLDGFGGAKP